MFVLRAHDSDSSSVGTDDFCHPFSAGFLPLGSNGITARPAVCAADAVASRTRTASTASFVIGGEIVSGTINDDSVESVESDESRYAILLFQSPALRREVNCSGTHGACL